MYQFSVTGPPCPPLPQPARAEATTASPAAALIHRERRLGTLGIVLPWWAECARWWGGPAPPTLARLRRGSPVCRAVGQPDG
ncbi:hypothetical protein GCM10018790_61500 [Kitasatospora xanthocidica]|nr:hypothetical protein GCM10018790_61500 [Kitasatospora xanthocidica]